MSEDKLSREIVTLAKEAGAALVGFADLWNLPEEVSPGLPCGVSIAVALNPVIIFGISHGPTSEYYAEYRRANELLNGIAEKVAGFLRENGYRTVFTSATDTAIDTGQDSDKTDMETLTTHLSHKMTATRAGMGWVGKSDLLVTKEYGSAVRITSVLTDAELPAAEPCDASGCGDCRACVDACPAKALSGADWYPGIERETLVDVFQCRETMRDLMLRNTGETASICGMCIYVCPWTQKYLKLGS